MQSWEKSRSLIKRLTKRKIALTPGEDIVATAYAHPMALFPILFIAAIGVFICLAGIACFDEIVFGFGVIWVLVVSPVLASHALRSLSTECVCTDRRLLILSGVFSAMVQETQLSHVEALELRQGFFGKFFGYGSLVFTGTGGTKHRCDGIENPRGFYQQIQEQIAMSNKRK